jgi:hypothetical protein
VAGGSIKHSNSSTQQATRPDEEIFTYTLLVNRCARRAARTPDYLTSADALFMDGGGRYQ